MQTLLTDDPAAAADVVRRGGLAAFPTETVYGLGADATDPAAVARIYAAKSRPSDNPLIVHLASAEEARAWGDLSPAAHRLAETFWPGPLTLVVPRRGDRLAPAVTAGGATVGLRVPAHPVARAFLAACGLPVAAPSANRSGRPSPTTAAAVLEDLAGRIDCVLDAGRAEAGLESTVVDCSESPPLLLRAGTVTLEALRRTVPEIALPGGEAEALARSPGTRHRHYAPRARVVLAPSDAPPDARPAAYLGRTAPPDPARYALVRLCRDDADYAHALYDFFRRADASGARVIHCEPVPETGLGRALMDRLRRAAAR